MEAVNCSDSELCIFLQALAEGYLPMCYSDINQSAPSKSIHIASKSWQHGRRTGFFPSFPSLAMYQNSMATPGEELRTSYAEDFPVLISQSPGGGLGSKERIAGFGPSKTASLAKYSQSARIWKTAQLSLLGDSEEFSETWPREGSIVDGEFFQAKPLAPIMSVKEFGFLLPTPTAHNAKEGAYPSEYARNTPTLATHVGGKIHPNFTEWMMGWPLDWTDLKPLGTDKFHAWLQQHGRF